MLFFACAHFSAADARDAVADEGQQRVEGAPCALFNAVYADALVAVLPNERHLVPHLAGNAGHIDDGLVHAQLKKAGAPAMHKDGSLPSGIVHRDPVGKADGERGELQVGAAAELLRIADALARGHGVEVCDIGAQSDDLLNVDRLNAVLHHEMPVEDAADAYAVVESLLEPGHRRAVAAVDILRADARRLDLPQAPHKAVMLLDGEGVVHTVRRRSKVRVHAAHGEVRTGGKRREQHRKILARPDAQTVHTGLDLDLNAADTPLCRAELFVGKGALRSEDRNDDVVMQRDMILLRRNAAEQHQVAGHAAAAHCGPFAQSAHADHAHPAVVHQHIGDLLSAVAVAVALDDRDQRDLRPDMALELAVVFDQRRAVKQKITALFQNIVILCNIHGRFLFPPSRLQSAAGGSAPFRGKEKRAEAAGTALRLFSGESFLILYAFFLCVLLRTEGARWGRRSAG